jgi:hypothetical protein
MLLLLADSLLLLLIALSVGTLTHRLLQRLFNIAFEADILGIFLLGLVSSTVYFNILSFWKPVDYFSLIPLVIVSVLTVVFGRDRLFDLYRRLAGHVRFIMAPSRLPVTACFVALLFYYWIIPPGNADSWTYHYLSILWYEKYKVVPGLANLQAGYAFNPAAFILQAPWSFTRLVGQSLYPLNGVLLGLFFSWLLIRSFRAGHPGLAAAYLGILLVLFTPLLPDMSAPTSDTLVAVCLAWAFIRLLEILLAGKPDLPAVLLPCLILLYAPIAKLSSYPALPVLLLIFFLLPYRERGGGLLLKMTGLACLIYIPWLIRNYIMTGHLVFPFAGLDFFNPDWKVPDSLMRLEYFNIRVDTKLSADNVTVSTPLPLSRWFLPWINTFFWKKTPLDALFFFAGIASPVYWLIARMMEKKTGLRPFLLWLFIYAGIWTWFLTAPILRFGAVLLILSIAIPFISFFHAAPRQARRYPLLLTLLFVAGAFYFIRSGSRKPTTYPFTLKDCWLLPLKDIAYSTDGGSGQKSSFRYRTLSTGVRLYIADLHHGCINTDLPCMVTDYGEVEMRGSRIDEGFRMKIDMIPVRFPQIR